MLDCKNGGLSLKAFGSQKWMESAESAPAEVGVACNEFVRWQGCHHDLSRKHSSRVGGLAGQLGGQLLSALFMILLISYSASFSGLGVTSSHILWNNEFQWSFTLPFLFCFGVLVLEICRTRWIPMVVTFSSSSSQLSAVDRHRDEVMWPMLRAVNSVDLKGIFWSQMETDAKFFLASVM